MISSSNITFYVCVMLTFVGLIFLIIAYRSWDNSYTIIKKGVQTEGVVLELVNRKVKQSSTTSLAPVVQFKTQKDEVITYYSTTYTTPCPYVVGQIVPIWYLPDNPQQATLKGTDAYLLPFVFTGFGLLAMLFGLPTVLKFLIKYMFQ